MIYLKEIKFDNKNLFYEDKLKIGDTILLGTKGIWEITYIHKDNKFWCGGYPTEFKVGDSYNKIFKPSFLIWINSLFKNFNKNDVISGYDDDKKEVIGTINDIHHSTISQTHIWVECNETGYTIPLNILTCKKL